MDMPKTLLAASAFAIALGLPGLVGAQDVDEALAAEGERVFRQCQACHMVGPDAQARVGPPLTGVVGRTAGTVEGFRYSDAMVEAGANGLVWTEEELNTYLENPREKVEGTTMVFPGLRQEEQRLAVVEYIKQQSQ
jgi:cytochrome c